MTRRRRSLVLALGVLGIGAQACQQEIAAPGACPAFCPSTRIQVVDTIIQGSVSGDSTFRGYVAAHRAASLQLVSEGAAPTSRGVLRFTQFPDSITAVVGGVTEPIVALDSFRITVRVRRRDENRSDLSIALHRLPATVDTTTSVAALVPFFADSTRIAIIDVPADLGADSTLTAVVLPDAFPTFDADERIAAVGIALHGPEPTFLDLGTTEGGRSALLTRFVQVENAANEMEPRSDARSPAVDTFVSEAPPPLPADVLAAGGLPSARSFLRVGLPRSIVDESEVSRATLVLRLAGAVFGAPGDTLQVRADGLAADFGPKSPLAIPRSIPPAAALLEIGRAHV